jgi:hypothetical protein
LRFLRYEVLFAFVKREMHFTISSLDSS